MEIPAPDVPALEKLPLYDLPESPPANGYSGERVPTFSRKSVWKRPVNILQGQSKKEVFSSFFKERLKI